MCLEGTTPQDMWHFRRRTAFQAELLSYPYPRTSSPVTIASLCTAFQAVYTPSISGILQYSLLACQSNLLVLLAVEVVHRLDGIERAEGHFHEYRGPVAHRAVPQAGQLEGFQFAAVLALVGDEARERVHVLR